MKKLTKDDAFQIFKIINESSMLGALKKTKVNYKLFPYCLSILLTFDSILEGSSLTPDETVKQFCYDTDGKRLSDKDLETKYFELLEKVEEKLLSVGTDDSLIDGTRNFSIENGEVTVYI